MAFTINWDKYENDWEKKLLKGTCK